MVALKFSSFAVKIISAPLFLHFIADTTSITDNAEIIIFKFHLPHKTHKIKGR